MSACVIGLTGGIGSGKSAAADCFAALGAALVDTDAIAHELTAPGGAAMSRLRAAFGETVVTPDGALDRPRMRQVAFADAGARARLEGILHPLIRDISAQRCAAANSPYVILAVPLLIESGTYRERCDRIVVVDCPEDVQVARVMARNGMAAAEVRSIMAAQASRQERLAAADDVIDNSGSPDELAARVAILHANYLVLAATKLKANC